MKELESLEGVKVNVTHSRVHSLETHNFHINRYKRCLYCEMGSKPVPKAALQEDGRDNEGI